MIINDVCKYGIKSSIKAGEANDGEYMFFTSSSDESKRYSEYQYDCEGIVMGTGGNATLHYYNGKFATSTDCVVLLTNNNIKCKYLFYILKSKMDVLEAGFKGAGLKHINKNYIGNIDIGTIPSLKEQNEIIKAFDNISSISNSLNKKICLLEELVKARFVEMFENEDLPIGKISDIAIDKVNTAKKDFNQNEQIKYIDISSIDNSNNSMTGYTEYILKDAPSRAQQHIKKDDILVSTVRPNLKNVAINTIDEDNLIASSGFCVLRVKDNCLPYYLLSIVCSDKFTNKMTELTTGANYPAIHNSDVMNYEIKIPTIDKQKEFSMFAEQIDKSKFVIQKQIDETQKLFDSLMQLYFG